MYYIIVTIIVFTHNNTTEYFCADKDQLLLLKTNTCTVTQTTSPPYIEPEISLRCPQETATAYQAEAAEQIHTFSPY
jgi:hypothetical protein